jgi:hypothetical protein
VDLRADARSNERKEFVRLAEKAQKDGAELRKAFEEEIAALKEQVEVGGKACGEARATAS